jgi:hypothetical protein
MSFHWQKSTTVFIVANASQEQCKVVYMIRYLFVGCDVLSAPSTPKLVGGTIIHSSRTLASFVAATAVTLILSIVPAVSFTRCQLHVINRRRNATRAMQRIIDCKMSMQVRIYGVATN